MKTTTLLTLAAIAIGAAFPASAQETRTITDDLGVAVEIPAHPVRIVSLHDLQLTVPLIELGVLPIGSHGRIALDGTPYIRTSAMLTGIDFDNSPITFVGSFPPDIEAIAALEPDLILTTSSQSLEPELLRQIAPTLFLDEAAHPPMYVYDFLADVTGTAVQLAALKKRYESQIAQIRRVIDTASITVSVINGSDGGLDVRHTYEALGQVLRDAGFRFPAIIDAIPEGGRAQVPLEQLQEIDADFIFDVSYQANAGELPADPITRMEEVMPGYCSFLHACREGQYIIVPRDEALANSFFGLGMMAITVLTNIMSHTEDGGEFVPFQP